MRVTVPVAEWEEDPETESLSVVLWVKVGLPETETEAQEEGVLKGVWDTVTVPVPTPVLLLDCVRLGVKEEEGEWEGLVEGEGLEEDDMEGDKEGEGVRVTQGEGVTEVVKEDEGQVVGEAVTPTEPEK